MSIKGVCGKKERKDKKLPAFIDTFLSLCLYPRFILFFIFLPFFLIIIPLGGSRKFPMELEFLFLSNVILREKQGKLCPHLWGLGLNEKKTICSIKLFILRLLFIYNICQHLFYPHSR